MKCDQLKSGVWECVADGPKHPVTNARNQVRRRGRTKGIASKKVKDEIDRQKNFGVSSKNNKNVTFEKVANEWLGVYALTGVKENTIRSRKTSLKKLLKHFAKSNITSIDARQLQTVFVELFEKEKASSSQMDGVKVTANFIFKYAVKHKLRIDNPVSAVVIPKRKLTVEEIEDSNLEEKYFERHELDVFLQKVLTDGLHLDKEWFYLLAFTGMRAGELCALKWQDINQDENTIRITKTIYMPNHNMREFEMTPPKTKAAVRTIDVDEDIIAMLKRMKIRQNKIKLGKRKGIDDYHDGNFVFCRDNGYPYSSKFLHYRIGRIVKKIGLKKIQGAHILRHTHITMLAEADVDFKTIMDRVGHEDSKTTMEIYTHVTDNMKTGAQEKMKNRYGDILKLAIPKGNVIEM